LVREILVLALIATGAAGLLWHFRNESLSLL
jgi:hypothetical protein